jgi:hypothetical protein
VCCAPAFVGCFAMQIKRGSWQSIVNSFALLPFLFLFFVCGVLFRRQRDKSLSGSSFHSLSLSPNEKNKNKKTKSGSFTSNHTVNFIDFVKYLTREYIYNKRGGKRHHLNWFPPSFLSVFFSFQAGTKNN